MRKLLCLCLLMVFLLSLPYSAWADKAHSFPVFFQVSYTVLEEKINNGQSFVSKEHVITCKESVDLEINTLVDDFEAQLAPELLRTNNPRRNSRLDIHVIHTCSGDSCLSFLVLARETYNRNQVKSPFTCRVYDMAYGESISLVDILGEESDAWDVIAEIAWYELDSYFPAQEADVDKLNALCQKDALMETPFMLGPVCLTLHYEAKELYPSETSLMHVDIPYNAIRGMLTAYGERQIDNKEYKMVALTFDDGPVYTNTAKVLNSLRHHGTQATFFLVGTLIEENPDISVREHDEMHSLQSHHYRHVGNSTLERIHAETEKMENQMATTWGLGPLLFRAPYDRFQRFIDAGVSLPMIAYDVDTRDWSGRPPGSVLKTVQEQAHDGAIIRLHDPMDTASESVDLITDWLSKNGYFCVTVEDLFIHYQEEMLPNTIYYSVNTALNN